MADNKYRLTIYPAFEISTRPSKEFYFTTMQEIGAAKEACADLLLYLQDEIKVMQPYSNMFVCEVFEDGEWVEIEDFNIELDNEKGK